MALTVIFALLGSMILSFTLMPVLASMVLKRRRGGHKDNWLVGAIQKVYQPVLILREKAAEIERVVEGIQGADDITVEQVTGQPVMRVEIDREAIARFGIPAADVLAIVETLGSRHVGEVVEDQMRFDLVLRLDDRYRDDPSAFKRILIPTVLTPSAPPKRSLVSP